MTEKTGSRLPVWLLVSLVINALLVGLLIGGGLAGRKAVQPASVSGEEFDMARGISRAIPEAQRAVVRRALRQAYSETRSQRRELRLARRDLGRLVGAETYDRGAVLAAFARLRVADEQVKARLHVALTEQLSELSAEQRRAVLHSIERTGHRARRMHTRSRQCVPEN